MVINKDYDEVLHDIVNGNITEAKTKIQAENKSFLIGLLLYAESDYGLTISGLIHRFKNWGIE